MKELSIEEKAKRYDEALEKSKILYEQGTITESLCYVFPEQIDWLNAHHFDYRSLIEKGLALEAHDGMYNIKQ